MRIAVIPARGGSKRIPRKNLRAFCGKPIIVWSIEVARTSELFDHVLVSTEDPEIAAVSERAGAEVPFVRPLELADDFTTTTQVVGHATDWALSQGWPLSAVCCIYATAPLIDANDIRQGLEILESGPWAFTFAATTFATPIFRAFREDPDAGIEMFFLEYASTRSQDLPQALHDAAQFYWGRPSAWLERRPLLGRPSKPVVIPRWRVQDIDEEDDWTRAEMIFHQLRALA